MIDGSEVKDRETLYKISSYLRQDDIFHTNLTPREVLTFALNMTSIESNSIKKQKIN